MESVRPDSIIYSPCREWTKLESDVSADLSHGISDIISHVYLQTPWVMW